MVLDWLQRGAFRFDINLCMIGSGVNINMLRIFGSIKASAIGRNLS